MSAWIDAFLPTFGLIALGAFLRARVLRQGEVWSGLETLTFWVLLPALLVGSISGAPLSSLPVGSLAVAIWGVLLVAFALSLAIARLVGADPAAMTSLVQGGVRFNTFTALGIVTGIFGPPGLALAGVVVGLTVSAVQMIVAVAFAMAEGGRPSPGRIVVQTLSNPLLLACLAGFAIAALGGLPPGLGPLVRVLGQASLALGLLCVGAGLTLSSLREKPVAQALIGLEKLVVVPLLTLAAGRLLGLERLPLAVAVLVSAMPTATTAYVMARVLGGDARLMAAIITLQHVAALLTLPIWAMILAG